MDEMIALYLAQLFLEVGREDIAREVLEHFGAEDGN